MSSNGNEWSPRSRTEAEEEATSPFKRHRIGTARSAFGSTEPAQFTPLPWTSESAEMESESYDTASTLETEESEGEIVQLAPDETALESWPSMEADEASETSEADVAMEEEAPFDPEATLELDEDEGEREDEFAEMGEAEDEREDEELADEEELVGEGESDSEGVFSESDQEDEGYDTETWSAEMEEEGVPDEEWEDQVAGRAIQAGTEIYSRVPMLRAHTGIGPDLILAWNDMSTTPSSVDVVVHLHGFALSQKRPQLDIERDLKKRSGLDWSDPTKADSAAGRTRPTLALLPRGHFYKGKSGRGYNFPALVSKDGWAQLLDFALQRLSNRVGGTVTADRLIITAHSGGGAPLMRIVSFADPHEVHVFDGLYGDASALTAWALKRITQDRRAIEQEGRSAESYMSTRGGALRVLYRAGTARHSLALRKAVGEAIPSGSPLARWYRVERTAAGHVEIPAVYGWRLLADASVDLPGVPNVPAGARAKQTHETWGEAEEDPEDAQEELVESENAATVSFPNGASLRVVTGLPVGEKEEFWDPVGSGNPLLDTGPSFKRVKLSDHFTVEQLTTTRGKSSDVSRIDPKLVDALQKLRNLVGRPITISSGFRSWKANVDAYARHSHKAGKTIPPTRSQHCAGRAADIKIPGLNGLQIGKAAVDACGPNIGIGVAWDYAHIDVRGEMQAWPYAKGTRKWVDEIRAYQKAKGGTKLARTKNGRTPAAPRPVTSSTTTTSSGNGASGVVASLPGRIADAVRAGIITLKAALAIVSGQRDPSTLTNMIFSARHPELVDGYKIKPEEKALVHEWLDIRDRLVRPLLSRLENGSSASAAAPPSPAPAPASAPGTTTVPASTDVEEVPTELGTLVVEAPGRQFRYRFTPDDAVWTARFIVGEAGGRDNAANRAVIWAMFNRFGLFTHKVYPTFAAYLRAYSTPLQPVLRSKGAAKRHMHKPGFVKTGGTYEGTTIPKGQLRRHLDIQEMSWNRLPKAARGLALRALTGSVENPIGLATEFASTRVYFHDHNGRYPSPAEWRRYTTDFAATKKWTWVGDVAGLDQQGNAFFIDKRAAALPRDSVRVVAPVAAGATREPEYASGHPG